MRVDERLLMKKIEVGKEGGLGDKEIEGTGNGEG